MGAFVHPAGSTKKLQEPVWLEGALVMAARLMLTCFDASSVLARNPRHRSRVRLEGKDQLFPTPDEIKNAKQQMDAVATELGALLAPVREFIKEQGWADGTLLLCPTSALHMLPLAAAVSSLV